MGQFPKKWLPVAGRWELKELPQVTYLGPDPHYYRPFGICLTDITFTEGTVSCRVRFKGKPFEGRILIGYRSIDERYIMAGFGGWDFAYTIGELGPNVWRALAVAGDPENIVPGHWYLQTVEIEGQRLTVSVDTIPVLRLVLDRPPGSGQIGLFAFGNGPVDFDNFSVEKRHGKAFVVMKFDDPYKQLYEQVIRPVAKEFGLDAKHVGEKFGPNMILQDIVQGIIEAEIVVAEITPVSENENVFYELGYSHALNKPTILLAEKGKKLPFDVSGYRVLFYENTIAGKKEAEEGLRNHLIAIRGPKADVSGDERPESKTRLQ